jgi:predicted nucleotidyltransferase
MKPNSTSLLHVEIVAKALGELVHEVVFVGGSILGLYVRDSAAESPRPTYDVDVSVQVSSYSDMNRLSEKLIKLKFYPAQHESVLYRYQFKNILVDFIPVENTPLGPTNSWLKPGSTKASAVELGDITINILPISYFIATKWEAFKNRGNDPRWSHDFEDLIYLLDNSSNLFSELYHSDKKVQDFLKEFCSFILTHPYKNEIIECHLNQSNANKRRQRILELLEKMISI